MNVTSNSDMSPSSLLLDLLLSLMRSIAALLRLGTQLCTAVRFHPVLSFPSQLMKQLRMGFDFFPTILHVVVAACTIIFVRPNICATIARLPTAVIRRTHHIGAIYFPGFFIRNRPLGPRHIPSYLLTDGLTRAQTILAPHKGNFTFYQLQNHFVPHMGYTVSLIPTLMEALTGLYPSTIIQVSVPARHYAILIIERQLQQAINNGFSEGSSASNLIQAVRHHSTNVIAPNLVPIQPQPGASLATVMFTHPGPKEVSIALQNVLRLSANKKRLGALYPLCQDQHVFILNADQHSCEMRRRALNRAHSTLQVNTYWTTLPF